MKIGFLSLGCPKNLVDSEVMLGMAEQAGHEITTDADGADVVIVNTCAFIDRAKQESIDTILEMAEKKKATGARLVVTGCLAERYRADLQKEIPEIDALLGTGDVPQHPRGHPARQHGAATLARPAPSPLTFYRRDPSARANARHGHRAVERSDDGRQRDSVTTALPRAPSPEPRVPVFGVDLPTYLYDATTPRRLATPGHYAYVKIAEGCDYKCAFCVIPKMRGHYRSRTVESVVAEARPWPPAASRNCCWSRRTPPSTGSTARSATPCPGSSARSTAWTASSGCGCSTSTRRPSPTPPSTPSPPAAKVVPLHRPAAAARLRPGAEAHEAPRHPAGRTSACSANIRAKHARRHPAHDLHRRLPGRRAEADVEELLGVPRRRAASTTSGSSPTATRRTPRPSRSPTTCRRPRRPAGSGW